MNDGYWIVESVKAASGNFRTVAAGWCQGVASAFMLAEHLSDTHSADYLVIDQTGRVL